MGRLPIDEAIAYSIEIARALGAAHDRAIVHRDIKPQNVLVDEEGSAKVTDFGIARSLEEEGLTADGRVLGTTDYVSPEQALGHDVDGQSDIYSLGVVLYEMLTGDVPFHGENQVSVAMKHVREDLPDVQVLRPEVSARLAAVLDRMTDKDLAHAPPRRRDARGRPRGRARRGGVAHRHVDRRGDRGPAHAAGRARRRLPLRLRLRAARPAADPDDRRGRRRSSTCSSTRRPSAPSAGTGSGQTKAAPGEQIVSVKSTSANDFDPLGDDKEEHGDEARLRRRPGLRHRVDDRALRRQHAQQADRGAGRRPLHRRRAVGQRPLARDPDARAGLEAGDLRREHPADGRVAQRGWTKLADGTVDEAQADVQARHRGPALPLLPRLDHRAAARQGPGRDHAADAQRPKSSARVIQTAF